MRNVDIGHDKYSPKLRNFSLAVFFCLIVRLLPLRAPNVEPIMASVMPLGKIYGAIFGFVFGVLSILLYDILTNTLGTHTFFTVGAYGLVGAFSALYFKNRVASRRNFIAFAVFGTLFYDAATGLTTGPIFFGQSITSAIAGQIPFTAFHLLGNVTFAAVLSPAIYKFIRKRKREPSEILVTNLNPKII